MKENKDKVIETPVSRVKIPSEPYTYQFKIIGQIHQEIYERLLGKRTFIILDKETGQRRMVTEQIHEPLVTEWGANKIANIVYQVVNEQTPFSNFTPNAVLKAVRLILARLNEDFYRNFEKYFEPDKRSITDWKALITAIGIHIMEILARSVGGKESILYYNIQQVRQFLSGGVQKP